MTTSGVIRIVVALALISAVAAAQPDQAAPANPTDVPRAISMSNNSPDAPTDPPADAPVEAPTEPAEPTDEPADQPANEPEVEPVSLPHAVAVSQLSIDALPVAAPAQLSQAELREASDKLLALSAQAHRHVAAQEWSQATKAYRQAFDVAVSLSPADAQAAMAGLRATHRLQQALEPITEARKQLDADPQNAALRKKLIELTIIATGDFAAAAELLDDSLDADIRRLVTLAATGRAVTDSNDCLDLARWHKTLADRADERVRFTLLRRACHYYQQAVHAGGPNRGPAGDMLTELFQQIRQPNRPAMSLPTGVWIDLLNSADLEPIGDRPTWQRTEAGSWIPDPQSKGYTFGRFPIVLQGACQLQVRFVGPKTSGAFRVYPPTGDIVSEASAGGRADTLAERREQTGFAGDGGIHTLTVNITNNAGQYALSTDADGLPHMACDQLGQSTARRLRDADLLAAATGHIMLAGSGNTVEVLALSMKLTSGRATWQETISRSSNYVRDVDILADQPWQWVMQVHAGDILEISATGQWSPGGDVTVGPAGDEGGWYALRGKLVHSGRTFTIGERMILVVTEDDVLKMSMDDANKGDNDGAINVTIAKDSDLWPGDGVTGAALAVALAAGDAEEDMRMLLGDRIAVTRALGSKAQELALAEHLLASAVAVESPELAALLADRAATLAMALPGGEQVAMDAIGMLLDIDPDKYASRLPELVRVARDLYTKGQPADRSPAAMTLFGVCVRAAQRHADAGQWDDAGELYRRAQSIEDDALAPYADHLAARTQHAARQGAALSAKRRLEDDLSRNAGNASIRNQLITLNIVELADIAAAADLLTDEVDASVRHAVGLAARGLPHLTQQEAADLAAWYLQLADAQAVSPEAKSSLLDRAWQCGKFALFVDDSTTDVANSYRDMLAKITAAITRDDLPRAGATSRGEWTDLLAWADIEDGQVHGPWRRRGDSLIYYRPRTATEPMLPLPLQPRGDYVLQFDWAQTKAGGAPTVLCPLTPTDVEEPWTVAVPILAAGNSVTSRHVVSTEIHVRHVDGQVVIDVITDGKHQLQKVLRPGRSWHGRPQGSPGPPTFAILGGKRTLIVSSARVKMLTGYARHLPRDIRPLWGKFQISASRPWQTTLTVHKGDRVTISAEGLWSLKAGGGQRYITTPEGRPFGNNLLGNIAVRVGRGEMFLVASEGEFTAKADGVLQMQANDDSLSNNAGSLTVTVRIEPADK